MQLIPVSKLHSYPDNPRTIDENGMELLKQSLAELPELTIANPLIVSNRTGQYVILGGNQRLEAAKQNGLTELPCNVMEGLTEAKEREIVIKLNTHYADWNERLSLWADCPLDKWGVDASILEEWENAAESVDWNGIDKEESENEELPDESELIGQYKNKPPQLTITFLTVADLKEYESEHKYRLAEIGATWKISNGEI